MISSVPNFLKQRTNLTPNQPAIYIEEKVITFSELDGTVRKWVSFFRKKGMRTQTPVAICMPNSLLLIQIIFALQYIGAVTVFINTRLTKAEKAYQLHDAKVKFFLTDENTDWIPIENIHTCILTPETLPDNIEPASNIVDEFGIDDIATIMYTSGTTGKPKGVMQTYGNHLYSALNGVLNMGLHKDDRWLVQLPIFHVSGFSTLIKSMVYGMAIVLTKQKEMSHLLETIRKQKVTLLSLVAKNIQDIFDLKGKQMLEGVRGILLGGGPVPASLLEKCKQTNLPIYLTYGMTETASQVATIDGLDIYRKIGSVGKPLFFNQIRISNADSNGVGEILIKGPTVMKGYFNQPEETNLRMTTDGFFHTGDLGYFDTEGYLYIADRRSDLIISGGENIYPAEIEAQMMALNLFDEVAVVGYTDKKWGAVPVAFYVKKSTTEITAEEIKQQLQNHIAKYKLPKMYYEIASLPRNALGKVQKNVLKSLIKQKE